MNISTTNCKTLAMYSQIPIFQLQIGSNLSLKRLVYSIKEFLLFLKNKKQKTRMTSLISPGSHLFYLLLLIWGCVVKCYKRAQITKDLTVWLRTNAEERYVPIIARVRALQGTSVRKEIERMNERTIFFFLLQRRKR